MSRIPLRADLVMRLCYASWPSSATENPSDRALQDPLLRFERRVMYCLSCSEMRDVSTPSSLARQSISSPRS